jgi:hypothetical protein
MTYKFRVASQECEDDDLWDAQEVLVQAHAEYGRAWAKAAEAYVLEHFFDGDCVTIWNIKVLDEATGSARLFEVQVDMVPEPHAGRGIGYQLVRPKPCEPDFAEDDE